MLHVLHAEPVDSDDKDFEICHENVRMSENPVVHAFQTHTLSDVVQPSGGFVANVVERFSVVGVEHIVFYEHILGVADLADDVGAETQNDTFAHHGVVEEMHLSWRDEEQGVAHYVVLLEIDGVYAAVLLKPDYLVEGVDMRHGVVHLVVSEELGHIKQIYVCAVWHIAYKIVHLLQLSRLFHVVCCLLYGAKLHIFSKLPWCFYENM